MEYILFTVWFATMLFVGYRLFLAQRALNKALKPKEEHS